MKNILIIDDDIHIGNVIETLLLKEGYQVSRAYSGTEALFYLDAYHPDLVLLDLMLPGLNGEDVLPRIKGTPVIVLSAKVDIDSKVDMLLGGAVDYITKPFDTKELLARITVQLRNASLNHRQELLTFDDICIDTNTHMTFIQDIPIKLTKTEFAILKLLLQNPNQVIAKSVILDKISEDTPDCMESSLKVHMSHLRKKLKNTGGKDYIEAVWGIGFKMHEQ